MSFFQGIKRNATDKYFSDFIRERANWCCEWCGGDFSNDRHIFDVSHFVTRGNKSTRWDEDNVAPLCRTHHDYMSKNPAEHAAFFMKRLGKKRYDALLLRSRLTAKELRIDEGLVRLFYKTALKELNKSIIGHRP